MGYNKNIYSIIKISIALPLRVIVEFHYFQKEVFKHKCIVWKLLNFFVFIFGIFKTKVVVYLLNFKLCDLKLNHLSSVDCVKMVSFVIFMVQ